MPAVKGDTTSVVFAMTDRLQIAMVPAGLRHIRMLELRDAS